MYNSWESVNVSTAWIVNTLGTCMVDMSMDSERGREGHFAFIRDMNSDVTPGMALF